MQSLFQSVSIIDHDKEGNAPFAMIYEPSSGADSDFATDCGINSESDDGDINAAFQMISDTSTESELEFTAEKQPSSVHTKKHSISTSSVADNEVITEFMNDVSSLPELSNFIKKQPLYGYPQSDAMSSLSISISSDDLQIGCNPDELGLDRTDNALYRDDILCQENDFEDWWISTEYFVQTKCSEFNIDYQYDPSFVDYGVIV